MFSDCVLYPNNVRLASNDSYVVDLNPCKSSPCEHGGTCRGLLNGYICDCARGFTGVNCLTGTSVSILRYETLSKLNSSYAMQSKSHRITLTVHNYMLLCALVYRSLFVIVLLI